jgi:predicted TIM-barrel enzyme
LSRRETILSALQTERAAGRPILAAGASAGIIAKCADLAGADLIVVYSTGKSRLMGLPTTPLGDSNKLTVEMAAEVLNVVEERPVIGGVEATDVTRRNLARLLDTFVDAGYAGIINFPTIAMWPDRRRINEKRGYGFARECEIVSLARERDMFTMAYVFNDNDTRAMVDAGADCIVGHVGATDGGLVGARFDGNLSDVFAPLESMFRTARTTRSDVICLGHGGPLATPPDVAILYEHTTADGFVGASSIERIPVERAVMDVVKQFKELPIDGVKEIAGVKEEA